MALSLAPLLYVAECFSALDKFFAECPKKYTASCLRRHFVYQGTFAECHTRQRLC
jgi:hypothetical protein